MDPVLETESAADTLLSTATAPPSSPDTRADPSQHKILQSGNVLTGGGARLGYVGWDYHARSAEDFETVFRERARTIDWLRSL